MLKYLRRNGISYCLNYAAEEDISDDAPGGAAASTDSPEERQRDAVTHRFLRDVGNADNIGMTGFVAIKVGCPRHCLAHCWALACGTGCLHPPHECRTCLL